MEVRDPVHGLIEYDELEEQVINSRVVQRLRNIRQLAMANLVYPGAIHTRFDHSLGVMHIAGQIAKRLSTRDGDALDDDQIRNVRLAALLHDVGHGPFSHVSELPLAQLSTEYLAERRVAEDTLHEMVTLDVIRHDPELRKILRSRAEAVAKIIEEPRRPTVAHSIISGPLDADKLDYLLRDSYFCGVKYGVYDIDRVLDGLRVIPAGGEEYCLGVSQESVPAFEQHLMARYQMTTQVYRHRVRRCTDALLARAIVLAAEEGCRPVIELYTYRGSHPEYVERWVSYDDRRLLDTITAECRTGRAGALANCLTERKLPRRVYEVPLSEVDVFQQGKLTRTRERRNVEEHLAKSLGVLPEVVIIDLVKTDPPAPSSPEPGIDPGQILVEREGRKPCKFHEESDIFGQNPLKGTSKLVVYLPFRSVRREERTKERQELCEQVRRVLEQQAREA